jgi:hypothetical protein
VCGIVPSLPAGSTATVTLTDGGSGNFGGSNLATDGTPIVVSTNGGTCGSGSAVCFDVKKANHNGIDRVRIGGTTVVSAGTSTGFALLGPDPAASTTAGKVTCSPDPGGTACTNLFTSANDGGSTCTLEINGPVRAVVKCTFDHEDGSGNVYMHGTARYHFTKGRPDVRVVAILRNADNGSGNTFATAYKGHKGWEFRMTPNISGTLSYSIARHNGNESGTVASADAIRLYQAQSTSLKVSSLTYCTGAAGCVPYTDDEGYQIVKTVSGSPSTLAGGDKTQHPRGWMDISNSSGAGVTLGSYLLAATHQKSLEWNNGQARIGFWTPH